MSLADILAQHGIAPTPSVSEQQAARLHRIATAAGLAPETIMRTAECEHLSGCTDATVLAYALALADSAARRAGRVPEGWTAVGDCSACGRVWLWPGVPAAVLACPWCFERAAGNAFPRPPVGERRAAG